MNGALFYQTGWFAALCVTMAALLTWPLLALRIGQLKQLIRNDAEQRHAERERIARDLHDTLLQGVHALIFRLQAWESDLVIPPEQRAEIALATAQARALIIEARDRIAMLRRIHIGPEDLVSAFRSVADAQARGQTVEYDIAIVGEQRSLSADGFAHLLDIAKEAIINAFRHAKANRIGVTIEYQKSRLEVVVQDDGCGMPTEGAVAAHHFGLLGMRERALELDAELSWTDNGVRGTRVSLKVPAISIYPASTALID